MEDLRRKVKRFPDAQVVFLQFVEVGFLRQPLALRRAWRSEKTYRFWGRRFVAACAPKPLEQLDHHDIRRWLSDLAVRERVSAATRRQALNAVVFLFREALQRDPGDFSGFELAPRGRQVPTVLTPEECRRLFDQFTGTYRVMAQLIYAAGQRRRHP